MYECKFCQLQGIYLHAFLHDGITKYFSVQISPIKLTTAWDDHGC